MYSSLRISGKVAPSADFIPEQTLNYSWEWLSGVGAPLYHVDVPVPVAGTVLPIGTMYPGVLGTTRRTMIIIANHATVGLEVAYTSLSGLAAVDISVYPGGVYLVQDGAYPDSTAGDVTLTGLGGLASTAIVVVL